MAVQFDEAAVAADGAAPFFMYLAPGRYRFSRWHLDGNPAVGSPDGALEIELHPGTATCVGRVFPIPARIPGGTRLAGSSSAAEDCQPLKAALAHRVPAMKTEVVVRSPRLVPGRGSDAAPLLLPPNRGVIQLVTDARSDLASIPLPADFRGSTGIFKVCVSSQGSVLSTDMVKRMGVPLESQVIAKMRAWQFRPYLVDGLPVAFCFPMRLDVGPR